MKLQWLLDLCVRFPFCYALIVWIVLAGNQLACAQDSFQERLDTYLLEINELPDLYSFDVVAEWVSSDPKHDLVSIREEIGRASVSRPGKIRRHHARVSINAGAMAEHWFQTEQMRYSFSGLGNTGGLEEAKWTPGRNLFSIYQISKLPFAVPSCLILGKAEGSLFESLLAMKVLKEEPADKGGRIFTVLYSSGVGAARVHYLNEPSWIPDTVRHF